MSDALDPAPAPQPAPDAPPTGEPPLHVRRRRSPLLAPFRIIRARPRLLACGLIGIGVGFALPVHMRDVTRALIAWNVAVSFYLALSAHLIFGATHETIRRRARFLDEGRSAILFLATITACASIGAIVAELGPVKSMSGWPKAGHLTLTIATVVQSWMFMHLTFAFHYAHEYYLERQAAPERRADERGGLNFPGTPLPQYIDFLYFSYVIGVACATADVSTTSPQMRGVALVQSVLAFFYNLAILGLTVNIGSGFV
jgi:uncharacterized membrane protein